MIHPPTVAPSNGTTARPPRPARSQRRTPANQPSPSQHSPASSPKGKPTPPPRPNACGSARTAPSSRNSSTVLALHPARHTWRCAPGVRVALSNEQLRPRPHRHNPRPRLARGASHHTEQKTNTQQHDGNRPQRPATKPRTWQARTRRHRAGSVRFIHLTDPGLVNGALSGGAPISASFCSSSPDGQTYREGKPSLGRRRVHPVRRCAPRGFRRGVPSVLLEGAGSQPPR